MRTDLIEQCINAGKRRVDARKSVAEEQRRAASLIYRRQGENYTFEKEEADLLLAYSELHEAEEGTGVFMCMTAAEAAVVADAINRYHAEVWGYDKFLPAANAKKG